MDAAQHPSGRGRVPSPRDASGGAFASSLPVYQSTSLPVPVYQSGRALARDELPVLGRGQKTALLVLLYRY